MRNRVYCSATYLSSKDIKALSPEPVESRELKSVRIRNNIALTDKNPHLTHRDTFYLHRLHT